MNEKTMQRGVAALVAAFWWLVSVGYLTWAFGWKIGLAWVITTEAGMAIMQWRETHK